MKITTSMEHAGKLSDWLKNRGGIAVWNSINLSDPGAQIFTPALGLDGKPTGKPHWKFGNEPEIVTTADDVTLNVDREVKRFHVAVRMGSQGLSLKCTDASTARIHREVEKAGDGAYYLFDYGDEKNCIIMAPEPGKTMTLTQWAKEHA